MEIINSMFFMCVYIYIYVSLSPNWSHLISPWTIPDPKKKTPPAPQKRVTIRGTTPWWQETDATRAARQRTRKSNENGEWTNDLIEISQDFGNEKGDWAQFHMIQPAEVVIQQPRTYTFFANNNTSAGSRNWTTWTNLEIGYPKNPRQKITAWWQQLPGWWPSSWFHGGCALNPPFLGKTSGAFNDPCFIPVVSTFRCLCGSLIRPWPSVLLENYRFCLPGITKQKRTPFEIHTLNSLNHKAKSLFVVELVSHPFQTHKWTPYRRVSSWAPHLNKPRRKHAKLSHTKIRDNRWDHNGCFLRPYCRKSELWKFIQ